MDLTAEQSAEIFRRDPDDYIAIADAAVAYRKVGNGPDVVFSHGWPANGATFRALLPYLAPHVTCHIIDYPGAGDSRFDRSTKLSVQGHADTLRTVVDELGLTSVGVVGHDSGGMMARFAFAGDERVHGWGLIATEQPPKPTWRFRSFLAMRHIPNFERVLASVVNQPQLRRNRFVLGDAFADKNLLSGEFEEFVIRPLDDDAERRWAVGEFARNFDVGLFGKLTECHAKITAPVQLVWGSDDPFFPVERTRDMMKEFGGPTDLEVVDGAKLFVHEEFPEQTANALLRTIGG